MSAPRTVIFIGRSGCGKGTQARLLVEYLSSLDPSVASLYVETGKTLRSFAGAAGRSNELAKAYMDSGRRIPDFLAVWNWSEILLKNYQGTENLIIDGAPRSRAEAEVLATALDFYGCQQPTVVHLKVSLEWASARLAARGRSDDALGTIDERQRWFDVEVVPALDYFKSLPGLRVLEINGEQAVEKVHQDLIKSLTE